MLKTAAKLQLFFVSAKKHVYFFYFISHLDLKRVIMLFETGGQASSVFRI